MPVKWLGGQRCRSTLPVGSAADAYRIRSGSSVGQALMPVLQLSVCTRWLDIIQNR